MAGEDSLGSREMSMSPTSAGVNFIKSINRDKICCVGAGYVGGPTMAMIAKNCPHIQVHVVDISEPRIAAWNSAKLPIYEPGLQEVVESTRGVNLFFSTDVEKAIDMCDIIFVSVNTPTKKTGLGSGRAADLKYWELVGRTIARVATKDKIVVEKSTVPVRTAAALDRVLNSGTSDSKFVILSNPEFLAEGTAIQDLSAPDRILIGGPQNKSGLDSLDLLADVYANWVPRERILTTNLWSSELSKLVANAFLAQRVSSINAISQLCVRTGADVTEVSKAIGMDSRIGPKFLKASIGFGGSCFQKDILNLVYLCQQFGLKDVADYWEQVVIMNDKQKDAFTHNIVASMFNTVNGKNIAIYGFAFKKDTGDVRETPAIRVCELLIEDGAICQVYDPKVEKSDAMLEFRMQGIDVDENKLNFCADPLTAADGAHAIVVLTEWDEFCTYDYKELFKRMKKPAFIFDGRNLLDHQALSAIGFEVHAIGKASKYTRSKSLLAQAEEESMYGGERRMTANGH
ncbi:unnamed protein product [Amoebophrya sp. A25]|nr:unnamed protein product [Amoebophrya sp. A25]|eukprot:GSA25T00011722001.1